MGVILWLILCGVIAYVASDKFNRSGLLWFILSAVLSPLIAGLLLLLVGKR